MAKSALERLSQYKHLFSDALWNDLKQMEISLAAIIGYTWKCETDMEGIIHKEALRGFDCNTLEEYLALTK